MTNKIDEHQRLIREQFTKQAIPFSQMQNHSPELLLAASGAGPEDTVLDVACGPGLMACAFAKVARHVTGIDLTPAMIEQAKEALKPTEVLTAQAGKRLKAKARNRRKNAAFVRQGEWFFLPVPGFAVDEKLVLPDEPLRRGNGGKPHWAELCYRTGGETVYVCSRHPNGVTEAQYKGILAGSPKAKGWGWRTMRRNPGVYVRGRVRHADHATIALNGWHQVVMNTEGESKAMRNVAFLD